MEKSKISINPIVWATKLAKWIYKSAKKIPILAYEVIGAVLIVGGLFSIFG